MIKNKAIMKKLLLLMLGLALGLPGFSNNTNTKVFYAISSETVGTYTVKLNFQLETNNRDSWYNVEMKKTGLTYNGLDIYVGVFQDWYDGVAAMQFQLYDGDTWKGQVQPISSWESASTYNGEMYTGSSWIALSADQTIIVHYSNPSNWSTIQAYAWNSISDNTRTYDSNTNGTYGSNAAISANVLNSGYYDFTYRNIYNRIIFNNNGNDSEKTGNISIDYSTAREFWVSANDATSASSTAPSGWVGYTRTVTSGNFGTICLPFDATVTGATVYKITSKVMSGETLTGINLESVDALEAGKAYIFKATGSTLTATYSGSYTAAIEDNGMLGNLSSDPVTVTSGNYVVSGNKICPVGENVTVGQYKAYITLTGIGATSRSANFIGFEETTGIENIQNESDNVIFYNLQGQRVTEAQKGLVIVGGKKMLRK